MPIYEYKCRDCGNAFEELVARADIESLPCPKCSSGNTEKLMSVIGGIAMGASSSAPLSCASGCPSAGACEGGRSCPQMS